MSHRVIRRVLPSLCLAVVAAVYVWASYDYDLASRTLPWIAGVMAATLALIDVVSTVARDRCKPEGDQIDVAHSPLLEAAMFGWIGAFLALVVVLGFYAATPLYVFCYLKIYARKGALISAAAGFGLAGFLYIVFDALMGYEIFGGLIAGDYL